MLKWGILAMRIMSKVVIIRKVKGREVKGEEGEFGDGTNCKILVKIIIIFLVIFSAVFALGIGILTALCLSL